MRTLRSLGVTVLCALEKMALLGSDPVSRKPFGQEKQEQRYQLGGITKEKMEVRHGIGVASVRDHFFPRGNKRKLG